MSGQVPKLGLRYWKLRAWKLTLHLINVAEINAQKKLTRILKILVTVASKYQSSNDVDLQLTSLKEFVREKTPALYF